MKEIQEKSILKRKFPSVHKSLQKYAPQKGPLRNVSLGAYFRNFTVIYNFIKGHNISLPGCTPLLLSIILLSVMNSGENTKYKYK